MGIFALASKFWQRCNSERHLFSLIQGHGVRYDGILLPIDPHDRPPISVTNTKTAGNLVDGPRRPCID